ncbi:MAG TPA: AMP-binding protein [Acidimicrobiales bacterium]|nr:AMP-binding protein [Acidimicrobiales bacterium]
MSKQLTATYAHPLTAKWAAPGGPWSTDTLDDALAGDDLTEARVASLAGGLRAVGVGRGDAVAWQLANGPGPVALFRACWRLGAVAVPVHHLAGPNDVESIATRVRPTAFLGPGDSLPLGEPVPRGQGAARPADLAVALATSGSTGTPKLALHTHRALLHKARLMAGVHRLGPDDCTLLAAPLAHISGLLNGVLLTTCGMRSVPMARWDPGEALELIHRERVTFMIGPPAFFVSLVDHPGFDPEQVRSLRQVSCGGAGVTPSFVRSTAEALDCRVKRTYGSTEAPTVTTSTLDDPPERAATTDGQAVGHAELRVVDGELWVRGPELFVGYDDPATTAAAFADDGWFRTGDLATLDDEGWLTIVGRMKDVIIRGGENIAAAEIEAVLEAHADVRQAAVVGVPDRRLGERVCAFVVARAPFDLAACRRWCEAQGVTKFKWPERVEQLSELPLLPAGKPDRAALRRLATSG